MGFHINTTGYIDTGGTRPQRAKTGGCACGCDGRGPDPEQGGDLVQAMRALVTASKVDQALERAAPLHTQAKASKPLTPRGVLSGKRHSAPERATQGRVAAQGHSSPKTETKPTAVAPLRPRGILSKGGN